MTKKGIDIDEYLSKIVDMIFQNAPGTWRTSLRLAWPARGVSGRIGIALAVIFVLLLFSLAPSSAAERIIFGVDPYKPAIELEFMLAPLTGYLSSLVGKPVLLSISKNFDEHIRRIGEDQIDIAFMGPATYVEMVDRYGKKPLLARFETNRVPTYYGVIAVGANSDIKLLKDLKGKRFAFSDRRSTSGHLIPRHMFMEAGISLDDFAEHAFTGNHDNVALGILVGDFDAGAIKEEVFAMYEHRGLRILALTPPISEYLFIANSNLPPDTVDTLRRGLLQLREMSAGRPIMKAMNPSATALVPVDDSDYDNLRGILRELKEGGITP